MWAVKYFVGCNDGKSSGHILKFLNGKRRSDTLLSMQIAGLSMHESEALSRRLYIPKHETHELGYEMRQEPCQATTVHVFFEGETACAIRGGVGAHCRTLSLLRAHGGISWGPMTLMSTPDSDLTWLVTSNLSSQTQTGSNSSGNCTLMATPEKIVQ